MASYPENDFEFSGWLGNFITVAGANLAALRLTDGDIDTLTDIKATLDARLTTETAAKEAALAATAAKASARKDANTQAGFRANMIAANADVSDALKEQLGLNVRSKPTATAPAIPKDVTVEPFANGVNRLAWNKNGNIPRTVYVVEQKISQNGGWRMVGAVTATKFDHAAQKPGRHVVYRVKAKRGQVETAASPETVAYADAAFPLEDNGIV